MEAERPAWGRRTWNGTAYRIALLTLLLSYLVHLRVLGLQFPVPWPDEGSFLWPAIAMQEGNTLFAPELNPDRPVMWMPPGYMVVQGLIFKATGFSLEWARTLSALYMCAAVAMLAAFLAESRARWLHLGLAAVFLHSPILLLAGNLARMEPLLLMVLTGSLLLIRHDYVWPGLALALLVPLIHPNGVYFALGAVVYFAIRVWRKPRADRRWAWGLLWLSAATLLWMVYGAYVLRNWDTFVSDMSFQISWKRFMDASTGGTWVRASHSENTVPALLAALLAIHAAYWGSALTPLFAFIVPARVLALTALGWSYDIYTALEYFLICCLGVDAVWTVCSRLPVRLIREQHILACGATLALAVLSHRLLTSDSPLTRSTDVAIANIDHRSAPAYFEPADAEAVRAYLASLRNRGEKVIVQLYPLSDALLFWDLEGSGLRFSQPTFHTHPADVYVFHQSRHLSAEHRRMIENGITFRALISLPLDQWKVIRSRDETERWLAYRRPAAPQGQPLD